MGWNSSVHPCSPPLLSRWYNIIVSTNTINIIDTKNFFPIFVPQAYSTMAKTEYTALNLPKTLVEELKVWRMAFCASYGKQVSYGEMLRGMLDSLEDSDPGVVAEMDRLLEKHPELAEKMGNYSVNGEGGQQ